MGLAPFHVFLKGGLAPFLGGAIIEAGEVSRGDVAKVTHEIHHLVVAHHSEDAAPGSGRLFVQREHQVQDLAWLWSAVEEVTQLHESCISAGPASLVIDELNSLQNSGEILEVAVDVSDGNERAGGGWPRGWDS